MLRLCAIVCLAALAPLGSHVAAQPAASPAASHAALPRVVPNDNRRAAGTTRAGVTEIRLVARMARWHAAGARDSAVVVPAFSEVGGGAPRIPAPLVRVPVGTRVRFVVRNELPDTMTFCARAAARCGSPDTLRLAPGATGTVETVADRAGTFAYFGAMRRVIHGHRAALRSPMSGAFVVDEPGAAARDRIIVINGYAAPRDSAEGGEAKGERFLLTMNGLLWPHTERFVHETGDTVRWRVVNGSASEHPMHLHGFYFDVLSRGDGHTDTVYAADRRRPAVTESMVPMSTMTLEWVPTRAGNWLFHCHKAMHVAVARRADLRDEAPRSAPVLAGTVAAASHLAHGANHALEGMSGMVMGIEVRPRRGAASVAVPDERARRIRLLAQQRPGYFGADAALGFAVQSGAAEPTSDSLGVPGTPLVLTRDEPVSITVVNRLGEPTGVHWHGIELESYFDGVAGWSGAGTRVAPMIAPADSFVAHFTPPRAGTFIYHAHSDEMRQLSSGLVGALVVLEPGQRWNRETDHLIVVAQGGPNDTASVTVNGRASHQAIALKPGVPHRFRVIVITPQDDVDVTLLKGGATATWRAVAKDGADLPAALAVEERAHRRFGPGETFDFEIVPAPGEMHLAIASFTNVLLTLQAR